MLVLEVERAVVTKQLVVSVEVHDATSVEVHDATKQLAVSVEVPDATSVVKVLDAISVEVPLRDKRH
jgi:hypothetical protein